MRFIYSALAVTASTLTAAAGIVAGVNHTKFGQKHAPAKVKKVTEAIEEKTVLGCRLAKAEAIKTAGLVKMLTKDEFKTVCKDARQNALADYRAGQAAKAKQ
jgi:uncharacterized protein YdeI (YjbR/CyaY-like superfamily)